MASITNKHIIIGVTGGIAAYKTAELIRELKRLGAKIKVIMTKSAQAFITATTLQALSGNPVHTDDWLNLPNAAMDHIDLARWAHLICIVPASADTLSRLAHGQANDLLTTTCLATSAPIMVAPAMNQQMWRNYFVQDNVERLKQAGFEIIPPEAGEQACGDIGPGRLPEISTLILKILTKFNQQFLKNKHILITAGPTYEAIDPVRFLGNHSSGKMGYALAEAALSEGALVTLISGPTALAPPNRVKFIPIVSAQEMYDAVMEQLCPQAQPSDSNHEKCCHIFISAAAVSDFRPEKLAKHKIKKQHHHFNGTEGWPLNLIPNQDIVAAVASLNYKPFVVGFAAETENLLKNSQEKLYRKQLDMIIANYVGDNKGFGSNQNSATIIDKEGKITEFNEMPKIKLAEKLLALIYENYVSRHQN